MGFPVRVFFCFSQACDEKRLAKRIIRPLVTILPKGMRLCARMAQMVQENQYDYVIACLYPENLSIEHCRLFGEPNHA